MLDPLFRPPVVSFMDKMAVRLSQSGLGANHLTFIGFGFSLAGCFCVGLQNFPLGLVLILIGRVFDGLDGAVARATRITDLGRFLDFYCDFIVYAAFAFFFILAEPEHSMAAAFLLFSYAALGTAWLSHNFFTARRGATEILDGGLVEPSEFILFIVLCCLYPPGFSAFAALFGLLCFTAATLRTLATYKLLKSE